MVLVVAAALVFGIGKLIGTGSDQPADRASTAASTPRATGTTSPSSDVPFGPAVPQKVRVGASQAPLIAPSGDCAADEVSVLPSVPNAAAGGPIVIHLSLEGTQPACTFAVSPDSLVVKITSGADRIWSSQDCPGAIRPSTVVVRSDVERKRLAGVALEERMPAGSYTPESSAQVYAAMLSRAERALRETIVLGVPTTRDLALDVRALLASGAQFEGRPLRLTPRGRWAVTSPPGWPPARSRSTSPPPR